MTFSSPEAAERPDEAMQPKLSKIGRRYVNCFSTDAERKCQVDRLTLFIAYVHFNSVGSLD